MEHFVIEFSEHAGFSRPGVLVIRVRRGERWVELVAHEDETVFSATVYVVEGDELFSFLKALKDML